MTWTMLRGISISSMVREDSRTRNAPRAKCLPSGYSCVHFPTWCAEVPALAAGGLERLMTRDILIVGGGIGGLCAAIYLSRLGHRVRVCEAAAEIRALGVGINLLPH